MLPNSALPSVELLIPSDRFFDAMSDIGEWLKCEHIVCPYSTSCRNHAGDHAVCFAFPRAREAANFAERFAGRLAA